MNDNKLIRGIKALVGWKLLKQHGQSFSIRSDYA